MSVSRDRRFFSLLSICCLLLLVCAVQASEALPNDAEIDSNFLEEKIVCEVTTDCFEAGLKNVVCQKGTCTQKTLFPLSHEDIVSSVGAFFAITLAAGAGLGGGGLLVPMYIITMGISSHEAVPLSKATIFGSAIASFIVNARGRHPFNPDRPLIDYETMLMMEPMTLAGTIIGVNMNAICPEWVITILIVWLLSKTSLRTYVKGKKIWNEEAEKDQAIIKKVVNYWQYLPYEKNFKHFHAVLKAYLKWKSYKNPNKPSPFELKTISKTLDEEDKCDSPTSTVLSIQDTSSSSSDDDFEDDEELQVEEEFLVKSGTKQTTSTGLTLTLEDLKAYRSRVPAGDIVVLFFTWVVLILFSMVKGGHGTASIVGLQCGSPVYWSLVGTSFPFFAAVTAYFGSKISHRHSLMKTCGYEYAKGDVEWTKEATVKYPAMCTMAGTAAGLLGIGGGMVKGPLLLEMGLLPQVAAATSSSMILFTSSATTIQFIILGTLSIDQALWHGAVGFVAGLIGQFGLSYLIKKYRKTAFVIFLIAGVVGFSGMIMGVLGVQNLINRGIGGFRSLCPVV